MTKAGQKILLIGKRGQVGWELQRTLGSLGDVTAVDHDDFDLASPDQFRPVLRELSPTLIINAAAYTAVDKAEEEPERAMAINGVAPGILAEEARKLGAALVHYSTDYVFDGQKNGPYTEDDEPNPLSVYGRTKLAGDQAIQAASIPYLIFRTSWVYGMRGHNFLKTMLRLFAERDEVRVVDDQVGSPTWCRGIAEITAQALAATVSARTSGQLADIAGIYNLTASGDTSWCGFATAIREFASTTDSQFGKCTVTPISTEEYPTPANRPVNSVLSCRKLADVFGLTVLNWNRQLGLCMGID